MIPARGPGDPSGRRRSPIDGAATNRADPTATVGAVSGILSGPIDVDGRRRRPQWPNQPADKGLVVRHRTSGVVGRVAKFGPQRVVLIDGDGREHALPVAPGAFSVDGRTVTLVRPAPAAPSAPGLTASGSIAPASDRARVAIPSRIVVEGLHDAELVEKIWGDDLRAEGVVVEPLHGADDLSQIVAEFGPAPDRRLGVLLDHLVLDSKEYRLAAEAATDNVLIRGHRYVDVWEAVRPNVVGLEAWPQIPKGTDWKEGIRTSLGFAGSTGELWRAILGRVSSYRDLEPSLVGAVEELIDFVAPPSPD